MGTRVLSYVLFGLLCLPGLVGADELVFKNGDHLTGTVLSLAAGKITFESPVVGKVSAPMEKVESFATERESVIELDDGTVVTDRIVRDSTGRMKLAADPSRDFELAHVKGINPEEVSWHGSLAAGFVIDRGDTDEQDVDIDFKARWVGEHYRFNLRFLYEGNRSRTDGGDFETSDRLYRGRVQLDRVLKERLFVYTRWRTERDGIADLDLRSILGSGLGFRAVSRSDLTFNLQVGPAWTSEKYKDASLDTDYMSASVFWDLEKTVRHGLHFFHNGDWSPSLRDFYDVQLLNTETGLRFDIVKGWFLETKMRWELDTEPATGKERVNAKYIFALGWGF